MAGFNCSKNQRRSWVKDTVFAPRYCAAPNALHSASGLPFFDRHPPSAGGEFSMGLPEFTGTVVALASGWPLNAPLEVPTLSSCTKGRNLRPARLSKLKERFTDFWKRTGCELGWKYS